MVLSVLVKKGWVKVRMWREISRQRNELRRISEYLAKDIGISRADAEREADRPFWDYEQEEQGVIQVRGNAGKGAAERHDCCLQP